MATPSNGCPLRVQQRAQHALAPGGRSDAPTGSGGPVRADGLRLVGVGHVVEVVVEGDADHVVGPEAVDRTGRAIQARTSAPEARSTPAQWLPSAERTSSSRVGAGRDRHPGQILDDGMRSRARC